MYALISAWVCLLLGLLPLEIQSRALTLQSLTHRHRSSLPRTSRYLKPTLPPIMPTASDLSFTLNNHISHRDRQILWRALIHKEPPQQLLGQSNGELPEAPSWQRGSRGRRHTNSGGGRGHGHLVRVGCVLGTCQVQNLSHRLYQLIGQSGRDDSSPINPRSPHSYG